MTFPSVTASAETNFRLIRHKGVVGIGDDFQSQVDWALPDWTSETLFTEPDQNSFALIDGAMNPGLRERLDHASLPHICLFEGEAEEELGDVAPWLVTLAPDAPFTRDLLTDGMAGWHGFRKSSTLYFRTPAPILDLRRRLRRITKITDNDGKVFFFRFWEGVTLPELLRDPENQQVRGLFRPGEAIFTLDHLVDRNDLVCVEAEEGAENAV